MKRLLSLLVLLLSLSLIVLFVRSELHYRSFNQLRPVSYEVSRAEIIEKRTSSFTKAKMRDVNVYEPDLEIKYQVNGVTFEWKLPKNSFSSRSRKDVEKFLARFYGPEKSPVYLREGQSNRIFLSNQRHYFHYLFLLFAALLLLSLSVLARERSKGHSL